MITIAPKIADLQISANEDELLLIMSLLCGNYQKRILCKGVNNISINSISYPMQIGGIEFIDHKKEGWDEQQRYEFIDSENQSVHFFCREYSIT